MTNLDSILKSRDVTDKGPPMDMLEDLKESWGLKNWCLWAVVLEKTLESLLDCKEIKLVNPKGNQSWIFIGRTDVKLKLQYFGHLMWRMTHWKRAWCWERLKAGGEGDDRGWDDCMATDWMDMSLSKLRELLMEREPCHAAVHGVAKSWIQLSNWTEYSYQTTIGILFFQFPEMHLLL